MVFWGVGSIRLVSPLPIGEARRRLAASIDRPRSILDLRSGGIRGIFQDDELDIEAPHPMIRNALRPALRARLLPHGEGCRLVGMIGPPPWARVLGVFLFGVAVWFSATIGAAIVSALRRAPTVAAGDVLGGLLAVAAPPGAVLLFLGLCRWLGRGEANELQDWAVHCLQADWQD